MSTERTWFDYISLLIIPCIIYYVTNKETLNLDESAVWMNIYIYIYIQNVLESDFEPLCDGTTRRRSLADLRLLEGM